MAEYQFKLLSDESYAIMSYSGDETEVILPAAHFGKPVTIIGDWLFRYHEEITNVVIPDSVTDIGGLVFDGCVNITSIRMPAALKDMWQYAFARSGIREISLPDGVVSIIPFVFKDCKKLKRAVCGKALRSISAFAFQGCEALEELVIPPDTVISPKALDGARVPRIIFHR